MNTSEEILIERKTDQWGADDFLSGPRIFTIRSVEDGKADKKYDIALVEGGDRVWRPPNQVLELLLNVWGTSKRADWVGRRVELYRDPEVTMGRDKVGGVRVSAVSHISKPEKAFVMTSKGRRQWVSVQPLSDTPAAPAASDDITRAIAAINAATDVGKLDAIEKHARSLGIHETAEIQGVLISKRGELEGLI